MPRKQSGAVEPVCDVMLEFLDHRRWYFFAGVAVAYLFGFNGQWMVEPDGGLYLSLARNLALGRGYEYGGIRHETVYPGFPLALAGLYRIFGSHVILAADIFVFLCAVAALALTYRLILLAYDRPTAVLITIGVAFSHEFFQFSFEILTDMPFLMGVMAVLAAHEAIFSRARGRWWDWALLIAGVMVVTTTRPTMIGLLAAWIAALVYSAMVHRSWRAGLALVVAALTVLCFLLLDPRRMPGHGAGGGYEQYAINHLSQLNQVKSTAAANARALMDPIIAKAAFGMRLWPAWANPLFGIIVMISAIALIAKRVLWGLWVILTLATVVLFVSNDRYLLPILPLLVLGWWMLLRSINVRMRSLAGNVVAMALLVIGMGPNVVQVIGTILHQRARPFLADYQGGRYEPFANIAPEVARDTGPEDVILCPQKSARMLAFLTDRMCFEENEPYPRGNRLFVVADPADAEYTLWLKGQGIASDGTILAAASGRGKPRPIYLYQAALVR